MFLFVGIYYTCMTPEIIVNAVNVVFLLLVMYYGIRITRAGTTYLWSPGDDDTRNKMKFRILKYLVAMTALGLAAIALNLTFALLYL